MTNPRPETLEREKDKLWVTDAELIRRVGVPDKTMRTILPALESKMDFPPKVACSEGGDIGRPLSITSIITTALGQLGFLGGQYVRAHHESVA
jgi:hypothetical protein